MAYSFKTESGFARSLDISDPLKKFRKKFVITNEDIIYLDGNSLGRLSFAVKKQLKKTIDIEWGENLIGSWNNSWYAKSMEIGNKIALITGASPGEIIVCDNTSANLYKLAYTALKYKAGRTEIVSDCFNFPTDLYILQGIISETGGRYQLKLAGSGNGITVKTAEIGSLIEKMTALVVLSHVAFKSSFKYDIQEITRLAHKKGVLVLWDLSHSVGVTEIQLNEWDVDLAVGCTYKYLNGGPGSPAFLYIRKDLQEKLSSPLQGWFGDRNPFLFNLDYRPAEGIRKFLSGTPPVLNLMAIEPALDIIQEAGIKNIVEKSKLQTEYLIFLFKKHLRNLGFKSGSPVKVEQRGSHVTIQHKEGYRICQAMINPKKPGFKIIPDFREPDNIRLGIAPLYTTFEEIYHSVIRLKEIAETGEYLSFSEKRGDVT